MKRRIIHVLLLFSVLLLLTSSFFWTSSMAEPIWSPLNLTANQLNAVYARAANDVWAVGMGGTVLHYDGASWQLVPFPLTSGGNPADLRAVHAVAANDAWVVGEDTVATVGVAFHWNGFGWSEDSPAAAAYLQSVFMFASNDVWATSVADATSCVWHRDGGGVWSQVIGGTTPTPAIILHSIVALTSTAWAVGDDPATLNDIYRWQATTWSTESWPGPAVTTVLRSLAIFSSLEAWAVGDANVGVSRILHRTSGGAGVWSIVVPFPVDPGVDLYGVTAPSTTNVWAVGNGGTIVKCTDGGSPSCSQYTTTTPTTKNLFGVHLRANDDGWAVGAGGTILRWNGVEWRSAMNPTANNLRGVFLAASSSGWGVGAGATILKWNGVSWSPEKPLAGLAGSTLYGVHGTSSSDIWVVGSGNDIAHWTGSAWEDSGSVLRTTSPLGAGSNLRSVYAVGATNVWIVGNDGANAKIIHWTGAWTDTTPAGAGAQLNAVFMLAANDGWAVGNGVAGTISHWDGTAWEVPGSSVRTTAPGAVGNLMSVFAVASNNVWAVADTGRIIHFDGTSWSDTPNPATAGPTILRSVTFAAANDGWALGDDEMILHWDGTAWTQSALVDPLDPVPRVTDLYGVDVASPDGWAVGDMGRLFRLGAVPPVFSTTTYTYTSSTTTSTTVTTTSTSTSTTTATSTSSITSTSSTTTTATATTTATSTSSTTATTRIEPFAATEAAGIATVTGTLQYRNDASSTGKYLPLKGSKVTLYWFTTDPSQTTYVGEVYTSETYGTFAFSWQHGLEPGRYHVVGQYAGESWGAYKFDPCSMTTQLVIPLSLKISVDRPRVIVGQGESVTLTISVRTVNTNQPHPVSLSVTPSSGLFVNETFTRVSGNTPFESKLTLAVLNMTAPGTYQATVTAQSDEDNLAASASAVLVLYVLQNTHTITVDIQGLPSDIQTRLYIDNASIGNVGTGIITLTISNKTRTVSVLQQISSGDALYLCNDYTTPAGSTVSFVFKYVTKYRVKISGDLPQDIPCKLLLKVDDADKSDSAFKPAQGYNGFLDKNATVSFAISPEYITTTQVNYKFTEWRELLTGQVISASKATADGLFVVRLSRPLNLRAYYDKVTTVTIKTNLPSELSTSLQIGLVGSEKKDVTVTGSVAYQAGEFLAGAAFECTIAQDQLVLYNARGNTRYGFQRMSPASRVSLTQHTTIYVNYTTNYRVQVISRFPDAVIQPPGGIGWYAPSQMATLQVVNEAKDKYGIPYLFDRWAGAVSSSETTESFPVVTPMDIEAQWKLNWMYLLSLGGAFFAVAVPSAIVVRKKVLVRARWRKKVPFKKRDDSQGELNDDDMRLYNYILTKGGLLKISEGAADLEMSGDAIRESIEKLRKKQLLR